MTNNRATAVETVALRFRDSSPDHFTVGGFESGLLIATATFVLRLPWFFSTLRFNSLPSLVTTDATTEVLDPRIH